MSRQIWKIFLTKNDSSYLDIKLKVFKGEDQNAEFRLRQNISMGEADFNQFIRQINQLVVAADNFLMNSVYDKVIANQPICNIL